MFWAAMVGFAMGSGGANWLLFLSLGAFLILLKVPLEIYMDRVGKHSPYSHYVAKLADTAESPSRPWLGYLVQFAAFGLAIGAACFWAGRTFFGG